MATVFVTGVSGMIGKIVVASLLTKKHKVIGTDSKPCNLEGVDPNFLFTQTEITNKAGITQLFESNKIDFLVHLANTADNDFDAFISDKEMKQSKVTDKYLYDAAVKAGCTSILILSTTQVYGIQKGRDPIRETASEKGISNYTSMKLDSEKALMKATKKSRTVPVIARLAPIYTAEFTQNLHQRVLYNLVDFINGIINIPEGRYEGIYNIADTRQITAAEIIEYEKKKYRIGAVIQKNPNVVISVNKGQMKTDYRYFDPTFTFYNWNIDNTKARRISTFRWNLNNTK